MALKKELRPLNFDNQRRAIESHSGFVSYVVGKVNKIGLEEVLKCSGDKSEHYWLKKYYERVLNFAEDVQLKMVPQKFEGEFDHKVTQMPAIQKESPGEANEPVNRIAEFLIGSPPCAQDT